jgi:hypothetical protein
MNQRVEQSRNRGVEAATLAGRIGLAGFVPPVATYDVSTRPLLPRVVATARIAAVINYAHSIGLAGDWPEAVAPSAAPAQTTKTAPPAVVTTRPATTATKPPAKASGRDFLQIEIADPAALRAFEARLGAPLATVIGGKPTISARELDGGGEIRAFSFGGHQREAIMALAGELAPGVRVSIGPADLARFSRTGAGRTSEPPQALDGLIDVLTRIARP